MGKIIAIGGGEIGRPKESGGYYPIETTSIDKEIIKLSRKKNPALLFIPTASGDSQGYCDVVEKYYGKKLGCRVENLLLTKEKIQNKKITKEMIRKKILSSDIIYVGGGNTLKMMTLWRALGVDKLLLEAYKKGIVLSGLSAGAICWFSFGNSDSRKFTSNSNKLIKVAGLGFIVALCCPHYFGEVERKPQLKEMMKNTPKIVSIALTECCALEIIDNNYRILKSKRDAKAFKVFWKNGKYYEKEIMEKKEFLELNNLLKK
jgi:dipeptidase E